MENSNNDKIYIIKKKKSGLASNFSVIASKIMQICLQLKSMLEKAKCEDITHWLEIKISPIGRKKQLQKVISHSGKEENNCGFSLCFLGYFSMDVSENNANK